MRREAKKVVDDHKSNTRVYDGIIYIMHTRGSDGRIVPRYIGKSESFGKTSGILFCQPCAPRDRYSRNSLGGADNYAYHIGDLSAVVLAGHGLETQTVKYRSWANALFEAINTERPRLRQPIFFWVKAWRKDDIGIWTEFGPTRLTFLEYLLIGIASSIFPRELLNREGHNRDS